MAWTVRISKSAEKQLERMGRVEALRIRDFLRERVAGSTNPYVLAKPLEGKLRRFWRFRVGAYRLICRMEQEELIVDVVKVEHRGEAYR